MANFFKVQEDEYINLDQVRLVTVGVRNATVEWASGPPFYTMPREDALRLVAEIARHHVAPPPPDKP